MRTLQLLTCACVGAGLAACTTQEPPQPASFAEARLAPTAGSRASGEVRFTQLKDRVRVTGEIKGLAPHAEHGFHVHDKGDCSSPDAMSAGGHFNPGNTAHGGHGQGAVHAGDLPPLRADANGVALVFFETQQIAVGSGAANVVGRSLIVHRDPDDLKTQPTGNSGPRLACGVIART